MKIHFRQFFRLRDTFVRIVNKYENPRKRKIRADKTPKTYKSKEVGKNA